MGINISLAGLTSYYSEYLLFHASSAYRSHRDVKPGGWYEEVRGGSDEQKMIRLCKPLPYENLTRDAPIRRTLQACFSFL